MSRVCVYVEGPSDRLAMEALLGPLLDNARQRGVIISFYEPAEGDRKKVLLTKVPVKAANMLINDPTIVVAVVPDLYPRNKGFPHETFEQLQAGIMERFRDAVARKGGGGDASLESRMRVFCFKHDLEALLLACPDALARRIGAGRLQCDWSIPVENQNHGRPSKRVVEDLFRGHGKRYRDTADAPMTLRGQDYVAVADACPQCFRPFVHWLAGL